MATHGWVIFLALLCSIAFALPDCPVGCATSCYIPSAQNYTAADIQNGRIYVDPMGLPDANGTITNPYPDVFSALQGLKVIQFPTDVQIIVNPGQYEFDTGFTFDENSGFTNDTIAPAEYFFKSTPRIVSIVAAEPGTSTLTCAPPPSSPIIMFQAQLKYGDPTMVQRVSLQLELSGLILSNCSGFFFGSVLNFTVTNTTFNYGSGPVSIYLSDASLVQVINSSFFDTLNAFYCQYCRQTFIINTTFVMDPNFVDTGYNGVLSIISPYPASPDRPGDASLSYTTGTLQNIVLDGLGVGPYFQHTTVNIDGLEIKNTQHSATSQLLGYFADADNLIGSWNNLDIHDNTQQLSPNGACLWFFADRTRIDITNCKVHDNTNWSSGVPSALFLTAGISNGNSLSQYSEYLEVNYPNITFTNCQFYNNYGNESMYIIGGDVGNYVLTNVSVENSNGTFMNAQTSVGAVPMDVVISNSTFSNLYSNTFSQNLFIFGNSMITIQNVTFSNSESADAFMSIQQNTTIEILDSLFIGNTIDSSADVSSIVSLNDVSFGFCEATIVNTRFIGNSGPLGGAVLVAGAVDAVNTAWITNCTFDSNNVTGCGGALLVQGGIAYVDSTVFINNQASLGGAICAESFDNIVGPVLLMSNSQVQSNTASVLGGGLYVDLLMNYPINISSSSITNNQAGQRGGAVYAASQLVPTISADTVLTNNYASFSGTSLGGTPYMLQWEPSAPEISFNYSGYTLPSFTVALLDYYGQEVLLPADQTMLIKLVILQANVSADLGGKRSLSTSDLNTVTADAEPVGEISKAILNGEASFDDIQILGRNQPGQDVSMYILSIQSITSLFSATQFNLEIPIEIYACPSQNYSFVPVSDSLLHLGACLPIICTQGCQSAQGVCLSYNNCSCYDGWTGDDCSQSVSSIQYPVAGGSDGNAIIALACIGLGLTAIIAVVIIFGNSSPVVTSSSLLFCLLCLAGIALGFGSMFTYIGLPTQNLCGAQLWLLNCAFAIVWSLILAKNWRFYQVYDSTKLHYKSIAYKTLLTWLVAIVGVEVILLAIWQGLSAPDYELLEYPNVALRYAICTNSNPSAGTVMLGLVLAYNGAILVLSSLLAIMSRKVKTPFLESQGIYLSCYNCLVVSVIILALIYANINSSQVALYYIKTILIFYVCLTTLLVIFAPKVWFILIRKTSTAMVYQTSSIALTQSNNSKSQMMFARKSSEDMTMTPVTKSASSSSLAQGTDQGMVITDRTTNMIVCRGLLRLWREHRVDLIVKAGVIAVFPTEEDDTIGEVFEIKDCIIQAENKIDNSCFSITMDKTIFLLAKTEQERDSWLGLIAAARQGATSPKISLPPAAAGFLNNL